MANAWSTPHQQNYVPSTANGPIPADQWQNVTQPDANAVIQNCPCPMCSRTRNADYQTTTGTIENQDLRLPVVRTELVDPYANQNVGGAHPAGIAATVGHPTQAWSVAPQAPCQENAGYAPLYEVVDPPQVQMDMAPNEGALDMSVPERLRRLAGRYVSNPDSTVNGVHLEPGPSGRFQVVITIDIGDVLGDTTY
ncbi:hypothetical protein F5888DRAFT_538870 [Russula emetica]|nr:hypothetical protein F5888DRAFT_538870 [Russula emetica]